jgi:hypothetical protein
VKSISTSEILEFMQEGKGYSRSSFYGAFPDVDPRLVNDALLLLTTRGEVWNGNMTTYVKFAPKAASKGAEPIICPSHAWGNLSGYDAGLRGLRGAAEATRGAGYTAPEFGGNAMTGRAGSEGFAGRAMGFRVMK